MYKSAEASFWTVEEVDLSRDVWQWRERLTEGERFFLGRVLAFFASADGIVNENLLLRFAGEVQVTEARAFYGFQIMIENIHAEMYSSLLETLIEDPERRLELFTGLDTIPCIDRKSVV